jgi:hypothetical protein
VKSSPRPLSLRLYRAPVDGASAIFFTSIDRAISLVDGVTIVCAGDERLQVISAAHDAGLSVDRDRWPDGRRALVIQDRRLVEVA